MLKEEEGRGQKEEKFFSLKKKQTALIVFLYQEADLAQVSDSVLWTSCSSDGRWVYFCPPPNTHAHTHTHTTPLYPSIPPFFSIHCHPSCLLPIQGASLPPHPRLDSYIRNAQIQLGILMWTERNFSFKLFDWFYLFFFALFIVFFSPSSSLHLFLSSRLIIWKLGCRIKKKKNLACTNSHRAKRKKNLHLR